MSSEVQVEADTKKEAIQTYGFLRGQAVVDLPADLYIPPDAMEVILEVFEGPLDLLLYLIKKHNLDIVNIPVAAITQQYMEYVTVMSVFRLELAADYLEMAASLMELKSRMLLPRPVLDTGEELDPRAELVRRLQEYERFKTAAENLDEMPRIGRDLFTAVVSVSELERKRPEPEVNFQEVLLAFKAVLKRADLQSVHKVHRDVLSVEEKMSLILRNLESENFVNFVGFFDPREGRLGVIVTFLAVLELVREAIIELVQNEAFGPIYIRASSVGT